MSGPLDRFARPWFLTWEDGCYDHLKLRASMESILDNVCFDGSKEIFSSNWGSSRHDGHSGEYPIGQVVADMESAQYPWGEGVMTLKEQLSEAEKEIQRLLERCDGVSSNSPASLFSMEAMDPPPFLGEFGMEGFGNIFYVPENNYNHGMDWVNLI
ncbi:unnamed protein product [Camellia sinensis]